MIKNLKFKIKNSNTGFTLVEVLIYIAIIGIVVSSFILFSINISTSRNKTYVVQEVQANMRVAMNLISQKIRTANGVISPTESSSSTVMILDMAGSDSNLTFAVENGILKIGETGVATTSATSDEVKITNLVFTDLTADSVRENIRIEMIVEYNNLGTDIEYDYSQSIQTAVSTRQ